MRFTVCEANTPPVKDIIQQHYIPWYCHVDNSTEWYAYASGLGGFTLPLIAVIDPTSSNIYINRSTGIQSAETMYARLNPFPVGDIDHNGSLDLTDVVLLLQVLSGAETSVPVYANGDISGDKQLGLPEAINLLRYLAQ